MVFLHVIKKLENNNFKYLSKKQILYSYIWIIENSDPHRSLIIYKRIRNTL